MNVTQAACILLVAVALAFATLAFGVRDIPLSTVIAAIMQFDETNPDHVVVRDLRVARAATALLGGAALGAAGALMQTLTRNPLADPGLLGINAGAAFAVVIAIIALGLSAPGTLVFPALLGATLSAVLVLLLGGSGRSGPDPVRMVLAGAALSAVFLSLTWGLLILSRQSLEIYRFWVLGSFNRVDLQQLFAVVPFFVLGFAGAAASATLLNPLAIGDDGARALGARLGLARGVSAVSVILLCGATVSLAGPIAFVGLIVPHLVRPFAHADIRRLTLGSAALGATLAVTADLAGRLLLPGQEIEAGAMMALIGGPCLIILVQRGREFRV